jgi:ABC-type uncharacterized transport system substrate-binding protein
MEKKIFRVALSAVLCAVCQFAQAQTTKTARIGLLGGMSAATFGDRIEVFRQQLRELRYSEGKNIFFEERWAEGKLDQLDDLASQLVGRNVDVLVTFGAAAPAAAAKKATKTIPVVIAAGGSDPVATGLVASFARPGGNLTGMANSFTDVRGKQMELLKETIPKLSRVAILLNPDSPASAAGQGRAEAEARALGLHFHSLGVRKADEFESVFLAAKKDRAGALLVTANPLFFTHFARIAELAIKQRSRLFMRKGSLLKQAA